MRCKATAKQTGERCRRKVKEGKKVCHVHGDNSKNPGGTTSQKAKGNANAVATGEHESIYAATLTDEENAAYEAMDTSPLRQATEQVRLLTIREVRMLSRIKALKDADESKPEDERGFEVSGITAHKGWNVKGKVDFVTVERASVLDSIMKLEDALTRVQGLKRAAIEQLRKTIAETPLEGRDPVLDMIRAMRESRPPEPSR